MVDTVPSVGFGRIQLAPPPNLSLQRCWNPPHSSGNDWTTAANKRSPPSWLLQLTPTPELKPVPPEECSARRLLSEVCWKLVCEPMSRLVHVAFENLEPSIRFKSVWPYVVWLVRFIHLQTSLQYLQTCSYGFWLALSLFEISLIEGLFHTMAGWWFGQVS